VPYKLLAYIILVKLFLVHYYVVEEPVIVPPNLDVRFEGAVASTATFGENITIVQYSGPLQVNGTNQSLFVLQVCFSAFSYPDPFCPPLSLTSRRDHPRPCLIT
jgi:hypothetical protein